MRRLNEGQLADNGLEVRLRTKKKGSKCGCHQQNVCAIARYLCSVVYIFANCRQGRWKDSTSKQLIKRKRMKDKFEIVLFSLFVLWIILIPAIFIMKIKYFKTIRRKEFRGIEELFSFLNSEWWIAGLTWAIPTFGGEKDTELNKIRRKANSRLYIFYFIILAQLTLVGLLNKIA